MVLIPMLIREDNQLQSMAENTKLVFIKVRKVNSGMNKDLIQQLISKSSYTDWHSSKADTTILFCQSTEVTQFGDLY